MEWFLYTVVGALRLLPCNSLPTIVHTHSLMRTLSSIVNQNFGTKLAFLSDMVCAIPNENIKRNCVESNLVQTMCLQCCIGTAPFPDFSSSLLDEKERSITVNTRVGAISTGYYAHLSCTLNSSSMSSSSQLSSHSLSPSDFAAPGATPPRCARSVWESSQSKLRRRSLSKALENSVPLRAAHSPCTANSSNSSSSSSTLR